MPSGTFEDFRAKALGGCGYFVETKFATFLDGMHLYSRYFTGCTVNALKRQSSFYFDLGVKP